LSGRDSVALALSLSKGEGGRGLNKAHDSAPSSFDRLRMRVRRSIRRPTYVARLDTACTTALALSLSKGEGGRGLNKVHDSAPSSFDKLRMRVRSPFLSGFEGASLL
jgi:hypothetical protein